jgi:hypothetical protein
VTAKFNKEITGEEVGIVMLQGKPVVMEAAPPAIITANDWTQRFLTFIQEAQVPNRGEGRDGSYDLNKYAESACKVFRKMLEREGVQYSILVKSTLLYYKTRKRYAVKISKYIEEGLWRSDYEALLSSAADGSIEQHIQQEIDDNTEFSNYKLG